ncbi:hypothetical protein CsSME_00005815 [Camellia sinensis var. sinensis]
MAVDAERLENNDGLREFLAASNRRSGHDCGGVFLLLQGLRPTRDVGVVVDSSRVRSSGGATIFGKGMEAEMVFCVSEWQKGSSDNVEGPHQISRAQIGQGGRRPNEEGEGMERREESKVGRTCPSFNVVCPELGTATVGGGSSKRGVRGAEEGG